jgi:thiol-disulfide isomerase/thioredoxin
MIFAQGTKESTTRVAPAEPVPSTTSASTKRPDLNNLVNLTGLKAPNFVSVDMNGTEYNLENLHDKIVVINLWATWCKPCIEEMPELNNLVKKFKDKDVVFLAAAPEDKILLEGFLQKNPFLYQILPGALDIIKKYSPKEKADPVTGKSRTIQVMPTHIVIDRGGTTVKHTWGFSSQKIPELSQAIEQLLDAKTK